MKVLYLTHRVPYAPNRGDRIRAFHTLRVLRQAGFEVYVVALAHDAEEERSAAALANSVTAFEVVRLPRIRNRMRALMALPVATPLTHVLLDSPALRPALERAVRGWTPDVVLAFCSGLAHHALERPLDHLPFVLDMVDVDSAKWSDFAAGARAPMRWIYQRESTQLAAFEARAARAAVATFVITPREAAALRTLAPDARVIVAGNGVDIEAFRPAAETSRRPDVVFTAVFDYAPNVQGAVWLAREVWPLVRHARPDARLLLVGARPTGLVRGLASDQHRVVVTGEVPDVRPYLWSASVAVAPLAIARGTQNKVLEALAAGVPAVVTPAVLDGLPAQAAQACTVAREAPEFAGAILEALANAPDTMPSHPVQGLDWHRALQPLMDVLIEAGADPR